MTGAPATGGGRIGRVGPLRDRWLVLGAVAILVAVVAVGTFAVASKSPAATPSPIVRSSTGQTSLDEAMKGINDDGTWSAQTALAVFAASFGPLPGVDAPPPDRSYHSGTTAIEMVEAHWSELTDAQRKAILDYIGPAAAAIVPADFHPEFAALADVWQTTADQAASEIGNRLGHSLGIPIRVEFPPPNPNDPTAWAWAAGNYGEVPTGSVATACIVSIPPAMLDPGRAPFVHWLLLHEVWHCFESHLLSYESMLRVPKWVSEGQASWVAEAITNGAGAPPPESNEDHWRGYITDPAKPLYSRAYDAVGFWAQLAYSGIDPWKILEPSYVAASGGSLAGFSATGATAASFVDGWGSSWFRTGVPTTPWAMTSDFGILPASVRATPESISIADGDEAVISAVTSSAAVADLKLSAFVTRVEVSGVARLGSDSGFDQVVHTGGAETRTIFLCTTNSGDCSCPAGSGTPEGTTEAIPGERHGAVTGRADGPSVMHLRGLSKDEWCRKSASPGPQTGSPCGGAGCGGSNGDPHLKTISGQRFDLQAAGEYVLLRSGDGSVEIQGRQQPSCATGDASPPPSFGPTCQATINTAVAVKENGHRIGFYVGTDVPTVHVDGKPVDPSAIATADLGQGTKLAGYRRGYELDLPDGTKVWALSIGSFGINLLVKPSQALSASGVGLLAQVPSTAKLQVPALPDGTTLPAPADRHDRYHELYEVLAPAWRVTDATSLFDYGPGRNAASYLVGSYPPEAAPLTIDDVDPTALAKARTGCAAVTDKDLADQCAYDTVVTGDTRYVTLYSASDQLEAVGPSTLDLAPGATPAPSLPSTGGGPPTGVNLVVDHLANTSTGAGPHAIGPDGTVYVEVGEAGQGFGDVTLALLAVDGQTGTIRQRASPGRAGELAVAAGSLWVDGFKPPDKGCSISRLDPTTLAVRATVATVCDANDQTVIVPFGDAVWFVDPTGADPSGQGGHLRRIDPATNAVDSSPGGSIDMPFVSPFLGVFGTSSILAPTSTGLTMGDTQHGYYHLATGGSTFESVGKPGTGYHPYAAGDGLWVQTDIGTQDQPQSHAGFFDGGATASQQLAVQYEVVGADDAAVFTAYAENDDEADGLWSNPLDGSPPTRLATAGFVQSASTGRARLPYQDPLLPIMIGDHLAAKLWVEPSPTSADSMALYEQEIPIP